MSMNVNYKQYNPQQAMQMYMQNNKCDANTAKKELQAKFGIAAQGHAQGPQAPQGGDGAAQSLNGSNKNGMLDRNAGPNPMEDHAKKLKSLGFSDEAIKALKENKDSSKLEKEAQEKGLQLPKKPQQGMNLNFNC